MKSRYLDETELEMLRQSMTATAFLPFAVTLETGLRIGDVLNLKHENVKGRKLYYIAAKTGKAGVCEITQTLARKLKRRNGSPWCFPGRDGKQPLTRQAAWLRVKRACAAMGLDPNGISPHSLRKVFAVELTHAAGVEAARQALQHTDLHTTELYALSDWLTGRNAEKPLLRKDLQLIVEKILHVMQNAS